MRVLVSAFATSPFRGGEYAVGWKLAAALASFCEVDVICGDVSNDRVVKHDLTRWCKENSATVRLTIHYVEPSKMVMMLEWLHRLPGCWGFYYLAYNLWQRQAASVARRLVTQNHYDLVHQLNMIGYRECGYLWKLPIPFVWGPVGGGPNEPLSFLPLFSASGKVKVFLRTFINEVQKRICCRARKAAKRARKIWVVTDADYRMIHGLWGVECERMVETGTVYRPEGHVRSWDGKSPLRVVWSGIHTSRKALPILILALEKVLHSRPQSVSSPLIHVDVLGEGPEMTGWKRLAEKAGVSDSFVWHGKLPHDKALEVMNAGHIFAFPSLKEGTPHVVLESLSLGMPVICHDACGMGTVVNEDCGVKIPLTNPETSVRGFAEALGSLLDGNLSVEELSRGALARSKQLTWEAKAQQIFRAYQEVCDRD